MNNVMVLHIHKNHTDSIGVVAVLNEFVSVNEDRRRFLGIFTESGFLMSLYFPTYSGNNFEIFAINISVGSRFNCGKYSNLLSG